MLRGSFCPRLYDWITRLGTFLNSGQEDPSEVPISSGEEFRRKSTIYPSSRVRKIQAGRQPIIFPRNRRHGTRLRTYFFLLDPLKRQHASREHGARSFDRDIRDVCSRTDRARRWQTDLYFKGDTPLRRIANEAELFHQTRVAWILR